MNVKRLIISAVTAMLSASVFMISAAAVPGDNIALNAAVESCQYINDEEKGAFLVDADVGYATKWCANDGANHEADNSYHSYHWIILDFGSEKTFDKVRLVKASEGERDFGGTNLDASAFYFEVSPDKINWTKVLDVDGNESVSIYEGTFEPVTSRYIKLTVTAAEANPDAVATVRLYDLKVFEAAATVAEESPAVEVDDAVHGQEVVPMIFAAAASNPIVPRTGGDSMFVIMFAGLFSAAVFGTVRSRKNK